MENLDWNAFGLQILIHMSIIIVFILSKTLKTAIIISYITFIMSCIFILGHYDFSMYQTLFVVSGLLLVVLFTLVMERGSNYLLKLFKYL